MSSHTTAPRDQPNVMPMADSPIGEEDVAALSTDQTHSVILDMSSQNVFDPENRSLDLRSLDDNSEISCMLYINLIHTVMIFAAVTPKGTHDMEAFLLDELMSPDENKNAPRKTVYVSKTRLSNR